MSRTMIETAILDVSFQVGTGKMVGQEFLSNWVNQCRAEHDHGPDKEVEIEHEFVDTETPIGIRTRMVITVTCPYCRPIPRSSRRKRRSHVPESFRQLSPNSTDLPEEPTV